MFIAFLPKMPKIKNKAINIMLMVLQKSSIIYWSVCVPVGTRARGRGRGRVHAHKCM